MLQVPRLTNMHSLRFAIISLADCRLAERRRAIAAFVDSEWYGIERRASCLAYSETLETDAAERVVHCCAQSS